MSQVLASVFVLGALFWATFLGINSVFSIWSTHSTALMQASSEHADQLQTRISIASTNVSPYGSGRCFGIAVDAVVDNIGEMPIRDLSAMDVVVGYQNDAGQNQAVRPQYVDSGNLQQNQWTRTGISPDTYNVNEWDPHEAATLKLRTSPNAKPHTKGTLLVATPNGITSSGYIDFNYDAVNDCRYLHNNPTPPTGNTDLQAALPMDGSAPTAITLYNYDQDANLDPGRTITKSSLGLAETGTQKYQAWRTGTLSSPLVLNSPVEVDLWGAVQNYLPLIQGVATLYLRDYNGASYAEIGKGTIYDNDWQQGSTSFVQKAILIPALNYTVPAGHRLELRLMVERLGGLASSMWFAYDTSTYSSLVNLSYSPPSYTTLYYLRNNPTPPVGDTNAQSPLMLSGTAPTATTLYNYDQDYNANPGRTLQPTNLGKLETDLRKNQVWRTGALGTALSLQGDIVVDLWTAAPDFQQNYKGVMTVYLQDFDGATSTEIAHASFSSDDWQAGSSTWVRRSVVYPDVNYTVS